MTGLPSDETMEVNAATILVIEDDPSLRLLCRVNLELDGYHVLEADTIELAEAHLRTEPIDVVLLDLHVGNRHGLELLPLLRERYSRIRVCLLSGTSEVDPPKQEGVSHFIRKPFDLDELSRTVRALSAGEPATP